MRTECYHQTCCNFGSLAVKQGMEGIAAGRVLPGNEPCFLHGLPSELCRTVQSYSLTIVSLSTDGEVCQESSLRPDSTSRLGVVMQDKHGHSQNEVIQGCPDICRQNASTV